MANGVAKRDVKKESKWRRHVMAQGESGLSARAYCRGRGISEQGFHWWRRELARRDAARPAPPAAFAPVTVAAEMPVPTEPVPAGQVEIVLPGDRRVRVMGPVDRRMLGDVLAVLTAREGSC